MDSSLVRYIDKTQQLETTEYNRKRKNQVQKNQNRNISFKYSLKDHNIGLFLILTELKTI